MYLKAVLCLSVVYVYVKPYYIQRDRQIISGHPLRKGKVYVYFRNFSNLLVFHY